MSFRYSIAMLLLFFFGCRDPRPSAQVWLHWCVAEWEANERQRTIDLPLLRESFVTACNQSLAEQMNMTEAEFSALTPKCGFSHSSDTLIWAGFFSDSSLNEKLSPSFYLLGADTTRAISNYESCFYRTLDVCFEALRIVKPSDTVTLPLEFSWKNQ
jgi:hypothetical protein